MRKLILFFVGVLVSVFCVSYHLSAKVMDSRDIEFRAATETEDLRSALPVYGTIEGNVIHLTFLDVSSQATITIINQAGNAVSTETYHPSRTILYRVNGGAGMYKIQVRIGEKCFVGNFELK